eukprot:TRINITY_DN35652_c0_g1_i1.p1 TRINITY_DN35652_c0_g1~~TRINITY_DN35652_c0_g1_i1.p1  ORF type:complete len:450 (-),score=111.20 TRINITY_DN35652_c0_g1_i1:122-1471(-)
MGLCDSKAIPSDIHFEVLIVGGGNAAGYACQELAALGKAENVGLLCEEPVVPYERPALTKAYLHPPEAKVRARLPGFHTCVGTGGERQTPEWYEQKRITVVKGKAASLNANSKQVITEAGKRISYNKLIVATGSSALRVSKFGVTGEDLSGVFYLRCEADAAGLVSHLEGLQAGDEVMIVGGGYIGLECAAALVGWNLKVTMVFPESHFMPRLFNSEISNWMEEEYRKRGVNIVKGDSIVEILGKDGKLYAGKTKSGKEMTCKAMVIGVGGTPNVGWCQDAGLAMEKGGLVVDEWMTTSNPDVLAVGDIITFPSKAGGRDRCEHVDHARKSAIQAAKVIAAPEKPPAYDYLPYFYSRVYEYTEAPIVFNFYGLQARDGNPLKYQSFPRKDGKSMGCIWEEDGKVAGCFIIGSPGPTADEGAMLKEIALSRPSVQEALEKLEELVESKLA